jgi:ABC-type oligopeptide transport system ATPase subunit
MLTLDRVNKTYKVGTFGGKELRAVRDVSFELHEGEVISLIGESGSGKSTIGKMILRLLAVNGGRITVDGVDVVGLKGAALRDYYRHVQGVFQDPFSSCNPVYKVDHLFNVIRDIYFRGLADDAWQEKLAASLATVNLEPGQVLHKYPHQLSGGQVQQLLIARALMLDTRYLVADEIISMLGTSTRIGRAQPSGGPQGPRARDPLHHARPVARQLHQREDGHPAARSIVEMGATPAVFGRPLHPYTRMLIASVPQLHQKWGEMEAGSRAGSRAGTGWAPAPTEPCRYHAALPGGGATAVPTGLAGSGLAEVEDGHFVGCVQPNDDGTCGGRPASSS